LNLNKIEHSAKVSNLLTTTKSFGASESYIAWLSVWDLCILNILQRSQFLSLQTILFVVIATTYFIEPVKTSNFMAQTSKNCNLKNY